MTSLTLADAFELLRSARPAEAEALCQQLCETAVSDADAWFALGVSRHMQGKVGPALSAVERALVLDPLHVEAVNARIALLSALGRDGDALEFAVASVERLPANPQLLTNTALLLEGSGESARALALYERALGEDDDFVPARLNRGALLRRLQRLEDALANNRRLAHDHPALGDAHFNLADVLLALDRAGEALDACERGLASAPRHAKTLMARGIALAVLGRIDEAAAALEEARALDATVYASFVSPEYYRRDDPATRLDARVIHLDRCYERLRRCDWAQRERYLQNFERWVRATHATSAALDDPGLAYQALSQPLSADIAPMLARDIARRFERSIRPAGTWPHVDASPQRLRIGYVSADFVEHAMAHLILPLVELHDRSRVEVACYALRPDDGSEVRRRIERGADLFRDVSGLDDAAAAAHIAADGVHVLIDLAGYTESGRPGVLAHRPAPLQVSYLGYPGTTGAGYIDYQIGDRVSSRAAAVALASEKLVYLPRTFFPYRIDPQANAARVARRDYGLPDSFVFCAFNNFYKIEPVIFGRWMRILGRVPDSVLWMVDFGEAACANLRRAAAACGVAPGRLHFAPRESRARYLARFGLADLYLDTHWFNAMTTACNAMAAGLPVLTCAGETLPSRVAASLVHAAGMPQLVVASLDEYEACAVRLATDRGELGNLRRTLAAKLATAPLFDAAGRARELETAYEVMWRRHAAGLPPESFEVPI